jgi:oligopeptidase A
MSLMAPNPLLDTHDLPLFDQIRPEHVAPAMDALLSESEAALEAVVAPDFPADWKALASRLDCTTERLSRAFGAVSHLNSVADTPELRAAYNEVLPRVTEFWTRLGADERLYAKYKAINPAGLNPEQRQALKNAVRNFVLGGAELQGAAKERYAAIQERQAEVAQKFSENALDATDAFAYYASREELAGVPEDTIQSARAAAEAEGKDGYKITLKMPSYLPVMQFAHDRGLRERVYRAYVTRASDQAPDDVRQYDNTALIREILSLRQEESRLLGYRNFGEVSVVPKMAESPDQVIKFLRELAAKAALRRKGRGRHARIRDLETGAAEPQAWDWSYIAEKLKEERYAFSEQEVKQYFTAPKVLAGLFKIVETLFEVVIRRDHAPVWNPAWSSTGSSGNARMPTTTSAPSWWASSTWTPRRATASGAAPGWTTCARAGCAPTTAPADAGGAPGLQLRRGVEGKPALLTHDDVITLFHEPATACTTCSPGERARRVGHQRRGMGRGGAPEPVHGELLLGVERAAPHDGARRHRGAAAARAVRQDAGRQELPERAGHPAPGGVRAVRHAVAYRHDPAGDFMDLLRKVRAEVAVLPAPAFSRTAHTFSHIFAGGYAAGYYSYKWAEVLSADAYAAFEETAGEDGSPSVETGRKYRQAILEAGGSRPAMESFKAFRGREPSIDALLRHQGMAVAVPSRHTAAFWWANTPTVTTPGHWFTSVSNASGSVMRRPATSRMCWPLSVTSGASSLTRTRACPPIAANWRTHGPPPSGSPPPAPGTRPAPAPACFRRRCRRSAVTARPRSSRA